jgi:hypothetical protein
MQPIGTLTHRSSDSLARRSRIAIQARRDRLISVALPDFAVEVSSIDQRIGVRVGASCNFLGDLVVQGRG